MDAQDATMSVSSDSEVVHSYDEEPIMEEEEEVVNVERDVTKDGGVKKKLIQKGEGYGRPSPGDEVTVHYVGTLESDGSQFDSSRDRGDPFVFKLGQGQVIKGWDEGVKTMKKGERALFTIRADYGYGEHGSPPKIPGNATLCFDIELLSWKSVNDLTGDGGIVKVTLAEGTGWENPKEDYEVMVHYESKLDDGTVVESTRSGNPVEVILGSEQLPSGLNRALKEMKKGERASVILQPLYAYGEAGLEGKIPPNAVVHYDITLLSWKKVEEVTKDGGVRKKILEEPEGYKKPSDGSTVFVTMTARMVGGDVFDEANKTEPFSFVMGNGDVVEGLDLGVESMKKGEHALITCATAYCVGVERGSPPGGQAGDVEFNVTLVDIHEEKDSWSLSSEEKIETAQAKRLIGNDLFKRGKYRMALKKWDKALSHVQSDHDFSDEEKTKAKECKRPIYLNMAICDRKMGKPADAVNHATKALEIDENSVKALFRRGQARIDISDYDEALEDFKKARELAGDDAGVQKDIQTEIQRCKKAMEGYRAQQKKLFSKMFGK